MTEAPLRRMLILSGGLKHPCAETSARLTEILRPLVAAATIVDHPDAVTAEALADCDLLVWNCLRWTMPADRHAPYRAAWQYRTSPAFIAAVEGHLAAGRGLLALHAAPICFDDWPGAARILGARWVWGQSSHPPYGELAVQITALDDPLVAGLGDFTTQDERYSDLALDMADPPVPLLASAGQPLLWRRRYGPARILVSLLGHAVDSYAPPQVAEIYRRGTDWLLAG